MQIKEIILYNDSGDRRTLSFELGKVNIITGESKTGKTALIDIVNYCLGNDNCNVSEGVIRNCVTWFALLLQLPTEQVFIARQNPSKLSTANTGKIFFINAGKITPPELKEISNNSNVDTLKDFFTKKLFISEYTNIPETGTRDALTVNFKHSRAYLFQPQDLIAQRATLFFGQNDGNWEAQAIRDTLPFFLGAIPDDYVRIQREINQTKREIALLEKELREHESVANEGNSKVYQLIDELKALRLLSVDKIVNSITDGIEALKVAAKWKVTDVELSEGENENLKKLLAEYNDLQHKISITSDDLGSANAFIDQASSYLSEASEQKSRLESIKLFSEREEDSNDVCPICLHHLDNEIPSVTAINNSLRQLSENLVNSIAGAPRLNEYITKLTDKINSFKLEADLKQRSIKAIYKEQEETAHLQDQNLRKGKLLGRINLFLESYQETKEDRSLANKIEALESKLKFLEPLISTEEKESRLESVMNQVNTQMTEWSKNLDLEYKGSPIRLDTKKLTVFADTPAKSIPLTQMGSGANWVAYHLLVHFALHNFFVQANRPVPRFLMLDQPSQAYYPPDKEKELKGKIMESSDEAAVKQMYEFMFKATEQMGGNLQVIVTDHAKLSNKNFENAICEEWRNGKKLIPEEWIEGAVVRN